LLFTHENNEWTFDGGAELAAAPGPSVGYVAFFGDVSHGVTPVQSGHCVTLTYELYFGDVELVPAPRDVIPRAHERAFPENFEALLENPEFLPYGGTLGFGLRHIYPIEGNVKSILGQLKGSDAVVYRGTRALGFEPMLYLLYEWQPPRMDSTEGGLIDHPIRFGDYDPVDITKMIRRSGGFVVCRDPDSYLNQVGAYERPEKIEWVTPKTTINEQESAYTDYQKDELAFVYGDLCLVVRVGKAGERLAYPTSAQLKFLWEREDRKLRDNGLGLSAFWDRRTEC